MTTARLNPGIPLLLNGVTKRYGENTILNALDLHIPTGQFVAVVGRSGGGKSTLLRLLAGLEKPNGGELLAGSTPLAQVQEDSRMMFQDSRLLPWKTVIDNVGLGLKGQWRDAALQALASVGLENRAGDWPAALSGGQKQRVALARALIHRPRLLLLDEPLGALDALTRLEMQDLIVSLWEEYGFTVLLVTHDVSEAVAMADRVLLIEEGKIGLDVAVDIPRPRRTGSARLAELEAEVLNRVMKRGKSESAPRLLTLQLSGRRSEVVNSPDKAHPRRYPGVLPRYASALLIFSNRSPERFSRPFSCSSAARISAWRLAS